MPAHKVATQAQGGRTLKCTESTKKKGEAEAGNVGAGPRLRPAASGEDHISGSVISNNKDEAGQRRKKN